MPNDEEIIQDAYYIRGLINYSEKTKELAKVLFELSRIERAVTTNDMGDGFKIAKIRNLKGQVVETERVPFDYRDYSRMSGIIEGLGWLELEVQRLISIANEEDKRRKAEESKENQ